MNFCSIYCSNLLLWHLFKIFTRKFEWALDNIRIEKVISASIQVIILLFFLFVVSTLLDVRQCPKLQPYTISRKSYDTTSKNGKNPNFGPTCLSLPPKKFLWALPLDNLSSYHHMQFQRKLMNQPWKNDKKINFGLFDPNLGPKKKKKLLLLLLLLLVLTLLGHCSKLSSYTIKLNFGMFDPNLGLFVVVVVGLNSTGS